MHAYEVFEGQLGVENFYTNLAIGRGEVALGAMASAFAHAR